MSFLDGSSFAEVMDVSRPRGAPSRQRCLIGHGGQFCCKIAAMTSIPVNPQSVEQALINGDTDLLESMRGMLPWDDFQHQYQLTALISSISYRPKNPAIVENALLKFIEMAVDSGKKDVFGLSTLEHGGVQFVSPIMGFIENGMNRALAVFLDNGFDPKAAYGRDGMTTIEWARQHGSEATQALFPAYEARKIVNEIIRSIHQATDFKFNP